MRNNHEIDYKIYGEELQFVEIELDPGETVIGEPGGFMMMDDGIEMQTLFGDGSTSSNQGGLLGRLMNAGKRVLVGANLFMTAFTNIGIGKRKGVPVFARRPTRARIGKPSGVRCRSHARSWRSERPA